MKLRNDRNVKGPISILKKTLLTTPNLAKLDAVSALGFGTDEERMVGLQSAGVTLRTGSLATQVIDPVDMLHPYTIYIYICI